MDALFGSLDGVAKGGQAAALHFPDPKEMYKGQTTNAGTYFNIKSIFIIIVYI